MTVRAPWEHDAAVQDVFADVYGETGLRADAMAYAAVCAAIASGGVELAGAYVELATVDVKPEFSDGGRAGHGCGDNRPVPTVFQRGRYRGCAVTVLPPRRDGPAMTAVVCHCCGTPIYGCTGSTSFPDGVPFDGPEFHCGPCTERHLAAGRPCHVGRP